MKISETYHITTKGKYRRNPKKKNASEYFTIQRVPYGGNDTAASKKEYWCGGGPVGTISEWKMYARKKGYIGLRIFEKDNGVRLELI